MTGKRRAKSQCPLSRRVPAPSTSPRVTYHCSLEGKLPILERGVKRKCSATVLGGENGDRMFDAQKSKKREERALRRRRPCLFFNPCLTSLLSLSYPKLVQVIAFDKLDYCASLHNLDEIKDKPNFKVSERERG